MWILSFRTSSTIKILVGRVVLILSMMLLGGISCHFSASDTLSLLIDTMTGSTSMLLGVDCYVRSGYKEFWVYNSGLGKASYFPDESFRLNHKLRIMHALVPAVAVFSMLWRFIIYPCCSLLLQQNVDSPTLVQHQLPEFFDLQIHWKPLRQLRSLSKFTCFKQVTIGGGRSSAFRVVRVRDQNDQELLPNQPLRVQNTIESQVSVPMIPELPRPKRALQDFDLTESNLMTLMQILRKENRTQAWIRNLTVSSSARCSWQRDRRVDSWDLARNCEEEAGLFESRRRTSGHNLLHTQDSPDRLLPSIDQGTALARDQGSPLQVRASTSYASEDDILILNESCFQVVGSSKHGTPLSMPSQSHYATGRGTEIPARSRSNLLLNPHNQYSTSPITRSQASTSASSIYERLETTDHPEKKNSGMLSGCNSRWSFRDSDVQSLENAYHFIIDRRKRKSAETWTSRPPTESDKSAQRSHPFQFAPLSHTSVISPRRELRSGEYFNPRSGRKLKQLSLDSDISNLTEKFPGRSVLYRAYQNDLATDSSPYEHVIIKRNLGPAIDETYA